MSTASSNVAAFATSIGKKVVMALTGLFLCTFLIAHLSGNLLLLKNDGGEAFNIYGHFMATSPIVRVLEIGLVAGFLFHIIYGLSITMKNRAARPTPYKVYKANETSSFYSRFMAWSGITVLIFLVIHLWDFFFQHRILTAPEGQTLYGLVKVKFENPIYSAGYLIAMILLSFHLSHGFQSLFQSLGLQINQKLGNKFKTAGMFFAIAICAGFAIIPIYFLVAKA